MSSRPKRASAHPDPHQVPMRSFTKSLPMALLRAREAVMNEFRPNLAAHDLNEQQWRVLRALSSAEPTIGVGELANRTLLLGPSLSRILVRLEEQKLIARTLDPFDARRSHIGITPKGVELVGAIAPDSEQIYGGIERRFGKARLAKLIAELDALTEQESRWQSEQSHQADDV